MTLTEQLREAASLQELKSELNRVSRALTRERQQKVRLEEAIVLAARASFASMPPIKVGRPAQDRRRKDTEVAYAHCSDWHLGFDPLEVTTDRVMRYRDRIVEMTEIARADHPVRDAHIPFLGDTCHGEQIYPASPYEQDASLIDQAITEGADLVCNFLVSLLGTFRHAHVPWLAGNHGWLGPRKGGVYDPDSNLDRAMGLVVERRLMAAGLSPSRITFEIPRAKRRQFGSLLVDRVGEWSVLLLHGQQLKGGSSYGGLPFYGMSRRGLQLSHLGDHHTLPAFKDISCGHYHVIGSIPVMSQQLRVCGTLQSETSFEVETLAAFSRPAQLLMFVHPQAGRVTSEYTIDLT
jgi:hypothetical protein